MQMYLTITLLRCLGDHHLITKIFVHNFSQIHNIWSHIQNQPLKLKNSL